MYGFGREHRGRSAFIAHSVISVGISQTRFFNSVEQSFAVAQVELFPVQVVTGPGKHSHDAGTVHALPKSDLERISRQDGSPTQFVGGESNQPGVGGDGGHGVPETEAVGQEQVFGEDAEFVFIPHLSEENVPECRFGGGNDGVGSVPAGPGRVPATLFDVLFDLGVP